MKQLVALILAITFWFTASGVVYAAVDESSPSAINNSFELFWPVTAGKTMDENFYFLKIWKENLRGMFIFGDFQKFEYNVLLGTKRMLEAGELSKKNKVDLASQTMQKSIDKIKTAQELIKKVNAKKIPASVSDVKNRLSGMEQFLTDPKLHEGNLPSSSEELLKNVKELNSAI